MKEKTPLIYRADGPHLSRGASHCYEMNPGSWLQAAGCYHHPAGGKPARTYRAIVQRKLATLDAATSDSLTSSHFSYLVPTVASPTTEETTLLWAEPQTPGGK